MSDALVFLRPRVRLLICTSIFEGGAPKVLENSEGARTTPSVVAFTKGEFLRNEE